MAGVPPLPIGWRHPVGPLFGNELGLLAFDGRSASVTLERALPAPALVPGERRGLPDEGLGIATELSLTDVRPATEVDPDGPAWRTSARRGAPAAAPRRQADR